MSELYKLIFDPGFESVEEGILVEWKIHEDQFFFEGNVIALIETYKALIEFTAPFNGKMIEHCFKEQDIIEIPVVIAFVLPEKNADKILFLRDR